MKFSRYFAYQNCRSPLHFLVPLLNFYFCKYVQRKWPVLVHNYSFLAEVASSGKKLQLFGGSDQLSYTVTAFQRKWPSFVHCYSFLVEVARSGTLLQLSSGSGQIWYTVTAFQQKWPDLVHCYSFLAEMASSATKLQLFGGSCQLRYSPSFTKFFYQNRLMIKQVIKNL